jgi:hypothetical protein
MKKNLFLISEDEKSRILDMHKNMSSKHYLIEQTEEEPETEQEPEKDYTPQEGFFSRNPDITEGIEKLLIEKGYEEISDYDVTDTDCDDELIERHTNFQIPKLDSMSGDFGLIRANDFPFKHVLELTYRGVSLVNFNDLKISVILLFDTPDEDQAQSKQNKTNKAYISYGRLEYLGSEFNFENPDEVNQYTVCDLYKVFIKYVD